MPIKELAAPPRGDREGSSPRRPRPLTLAPAQRPCAPREGRPRISVQFLACPGCAYESPPYAALCLRCGTRLEGAPSQRDPGGALPDPEDGAASAGELEPTLRQVIEEAGFQLEERESRWKVTAPLPEGRKQVVHLRFGSEDPEGHPMVSMLSMVAAADPAKAHGLLRQASRYRYCGPAAMTVQGKEVFALAAHQPADGARPETLQRTLAELARRADELEAVFRGGRDDF